MKPFLQMCAVLYAVSIAAGWWWARDGVLLVGSTGDACLDLFQKNVRTPVFSGFITIGSFLLALKTTILARLKETYDTDEYREAYLIHRETGGGKLAYYGTLEHLSRALGWNVIFCLVTAFVQMSVGFVWAPWAFGVCGGSAFSTLVILLYLTHLLMSGHHEWFEMIEKKAQGNLPPQE